MKSSKLTLRFAERISGFVAAAAILFAVSVSPLLAGDLFYTSCCYTGTNADLIAIKVHDHNHVTTKLIGPIGNGGTAALAISRSGILYGMVGPLLGSQQLATINRKTGQSTPFGVPVAGLAVMAMTFTPDGTLYAVGGCNPNFVPPVGAGCAPSKPNYNALYKVDVNTGAFTLIGPTGARLYFMDLTSDREGNVYGATCDLFPSNGDLSTLYRIDRATGSATKVVDLVEAPP